MRLLESRLSVVAVLLSGLVATSGRVGSAGTRISPSQWRPKPQPDLAEKLAKAPVLKLSEMIGEKGAPDTVILKDGTVLKGRRIGKSGQTIGFRTTK